MALHTTHSESTAAPATGARYLSLLGSLALIFLLSAGIRPDSLPFPPHSAYSDAPISHWSNALYLQRSIQAGEFPLWRSLLMSGQPFAANPLNKVWYPLQWLVLLMPPALHLNLLVWLHMIFAGIGMNALTHTLGISRGASAVIGICFTFSPRLVAGVGAGHLDVMYAMAWSPAVLWALYRTIWLPGLRNAAVLAGFSAMLLLADMRAFIIVAVAAVGIGAYALTRVSTARRGQGLVPLLLASVLLLGLTAAQWMPLLELSPELSRGTITATEAAVFSLEPAQLAAVLFPIGSHETVLYSGLGVTILGIIGTVSLWRRGQRTLVMIAWAMIAFAAWYALGSNGLLWRALTGLLPPLLWLRVPPRLWWIAVIALLLLAGFGLDALRSPRRRHLTTLVGIIIVLELLVVSRRFIEFRPQAEWLDRYTSLATALLDDGVTRFYSPTYSVPQQVAAYWNIPDFGGVDPFQLKKYLPEFSAATGTHVTSYTVTLPPYDGDPRTSNRAAIIDTARLARWGVSHVVAAYQLSDSNLELVAHFEDAYIYRNTLASSTPHDFAASMCVGSIYCYQPMTVVPAVIISAAALLLTALLYWRGAAHSND